MRLNRFKLVKYLYFIIIVLIATEILLHCYFFITNTNVGTLYDCITLKEGYYTLEPNTIIQQPERYGDITYIINKNGFRDNNFDHQSEKHIILLLGDSISFGLGVNKDSIFANMIENKLQEKYKILNLGIFGYGPKEELEVLNRIGLIVNPNLVILQIYMNDFFDCLPKKSKFGLNYSFTLIKNRLFNKSLVYLKFTQFYQTINYNLLHNFRRKYFINSLEAGEPERVKDYLLSECNDDKIEAFSYINKIATKARERRIKFFIFISPNEVQLFKNDYDNINHRLKNYCYNNNIDFYDPLSEMRASPDKEKLFNDGLHLSTEGHKLMTNFLLNIIQKYYCF